MAPKAKADAKAAPKAKGDAKAKAKKAAKTEDGEEDKNKMQQPNWEKHQEEVQKVQDMIDKLQKENKSLLDQMKGRNDGKDDYFTQKAAIRAELNEVSEKMNLLQEQREAISKQLGDRQAEGAAMKAEVGKMKKTIGYTSEASIDDRIATIEFKMWTESCSLKDEKNYMAELKELKKNRSKVAEVSQLEDKLQTFKSDSGLSLKEQRAEISAQFNTLKEQKKEISARLSALTDSRKAQMGDLPELQEKKDELQKKLQEKIAERSKLKDDFNAEKRAYSEFQAEQRRIKQEKYQEEQKARQEEWKKKQIEKKVEQMDEQPHVTEITLIEQTIAFCKSLMPQEADDKKEEKKETVFNNKDGETVLALKKDRAEEYWMAPAAGKKGKAKKGKGPEDNSKKPIKHNAETFQLFDKLKLDPPITVADIPGCLEKLDAKMEMYQQKVKDWEANKDALKAKMLSGEVDPDDVEPEKEEEKEEDKKEEEEEEKEEEKPASEKEEEKEDEEKEDEKEEEEKEEDEKKEDD